ncbi:MAG: hypothetical protein H7844_02105 [Nitrospirae bacterium YQR-1]
MSEENDLQYEIERLKSRLGEIEAQGPPSAPPAPSFSAPQQPPAYDRPVSDARIESAYRTTEKATVISDKEPGAAAESPFGPIGMDIGTSNIVMAQNKGNSIHVVKQVNAFFTIPQSRFTKSILNKNEVTFIEFDKQYYIIGYSAENFANMFNTNTRRPMEKGFLSSRENEGITLMQSIIKTVVQKPKKFGEILCYSVPGDPIGSAVLSIGHQSILKMFFETMGYTPVPINEGLAVVMSELADNNFTGIGISMGGGMCNICLSYLSVPVITYSIQKGGDYIDEMVSKDVNESATKIKVIKEEALDLSILPANKVEMSLHIYYMDVINSLVKSLQQVIASSDKVPKITSPIPIVLSGGTCMPKGLRERVEKAIGAIRLPIEVSEVRSAKDPLNATSKGALVMAMSEER